MRDGAAYRQQAELFQALSHPVRLHILHILAGQEACVCHLTTVLGQRQPYVSQQLAALREAGLVSDRRDGTTIYYRIRNEKLADLLVLGRQACASDGEDVPAIVQSVPEGPVPNCPCPRCHAALEAAGREDSGVVSSAGVSG